MKSTFLAVDFNGDKSRDMRPLTKTEMFFGISPFKTEEDAINWVSIHIPFAIKPKRKSKTKFVSPFSSAHSAQEVINHLGKELFKMQNTNHVNY